MISNQIKYFTSTGDQTLVSHYLGECHDCQTTKDTWTPGCCHIHSSKEKSCPPVFWAQRLHWPSNVTELHTVPQLGIKPQSLAIQASVITVRPLRTPDSSRIMLWLLLNVRLWKPRLYSEVHWHFLPFLGWLKTTRSAVVSLAITSETLWFRQPRGFHVTRLFYWLMRCATLLKCMFITIKVVQLGFG